jgi:hypothetical protein
MHQCEISKAATNFDDDDAHLRQRGERQRALNVGLHAGGNRSEDR